MPNTPGASKRYYWKHREKILEKQHARYRANKEKYRAFSKKSYLLHREERLAYFRKYRQINRAKCRVREEKRRREHAEEIRAYNRRTILGIYINGKKKAICRLNKREYPRNGGCEICGKNNRKLFYHHWDDLNLDKGLWVCYPCHAFVEGVDKGLVGKYSKLRQKVEVEFLGLGKNSASS